jgi:hypothetical protein
MDLICPCLKSLAAKRARNQRQQELMRGAAFKRRTFHLMGLMEGAHEEVKVALNPNGAAIKWQSTASNSTALGEIDFRDVREITAKGSSSLTLSSRAGDLLLELEAGSEGTRDRWVEALHEARDIAAASSGDDEKSGNPSSLTERAQKQLQFQQKAVSVCLSPAHTRGRGENSCGFDVPAAFFLRIPRRDLFRALTERHMLLCMQVELSVRKKSAEERKNRYMKESGGLKYTALAMANRA